MKKWKKLIAGILTCALAFSMTACGASGSASSSGTASGNEKETPPDLTGQWIQEDPDSDTYQAAAIEGDTITVYWVSDGGTSQELYWAGTFTAPTEAEKEYTWTSEADHEQNDYAILASTSDTKDFTYKNDKITYEVSIAGETGQVTLVRNTDSSATVQATRMTESGEPVITESGDSVINYYDSKYVTYGVKIKNPNEHTAIETPTLKITGRAEDGTVLFSTEAYLQEIMPGETVAWGGFIESNGEPATVEYSIKANSFQSTSEQATDSRFTLDNISEQTSDYDYSVTGDITNNTQDDTNVAITVLLKNNGKIVGGYTATPQSSIGAGETTPFEADSYQQFGENGAPEHTDVEVMAQSY